MSFSQNKEKYQDVSHCIINNNIKNKMFTFYQGYFGHITLMNQKQCA